MLFRFEKKRQQIIAIIMCIVTVMSMCSGFGIAVNAADGTVNFKAGSNIDYGDYCTAKMTFDGDNTAYCAQPTKKHPDSGSYSYKLLSENSLLRKALFYLPGGYGYEKNIKSMLSGWSSDQQYVIGHLVVAYINLDGDEASAFYGAPSDYKSKAKDVVSKIKTLPAPPKSFKAFIFNEAASTQTIVGSWYEVPYGWIEIQKTTANAGISEGNGNYSLEGAQYGVFQGEKQIATLTTDKNGYAKSGNLEEGNYTVKELKASAGYAIDTEGHSVTVTADQTVRADVTEVPQNDPVDLVLQKIDKETGEIKSQGAASLENAEFTVKYYVGQSDTDPAKAGAQPVRTWVFKTDATGKVQMTTDYLVSGDAFYFQMDGATPCLPLGTVTVQETKAPEGYFADDTIFVHKIIGSGSSETIDCYNPVTAKEQIYRGDFDFVKVSDGELNRLANVPFKITSKTTGESHITVTDKNGYASTATSWNKHTTNTNVGKTSADGVWFGISQPDNSKGALIYDDYEVEELRCDANKGMNLLKFDVSIYKDAVTVPLGTLTDDKIEIVTTAKDSETGNQFSKPDEKVTIVDTVEYEGLKKGVEYKVVGVLMDKATGEPLLIDGEKVTAETTFKAKKSTGSVDVTFTFVGTGLKGKTVVVFEELYHEDIQLAVHTDIEDTDQTIYFPKVGTTVKDAESGTNVAKADEKVTLIDTVSYKNLIPGKEYTVTGTLMDQKTEKPVELDGKSVTEEATFKAESTEGTVDVTFEFDGTSLAGTSVVVFESISYEGKEIAVHADINDEGQTITFPENPKETPKETPKVDTPKTGDDSNVKVWIATAVICLGALAGYGVATYKKKRKKEVK